MELDFNGRSSGSSSLKRLPAPGAVALVFEKKKGHTAAGLHGILTRFPFHRTVEGCETVVGAKVYLFGILQKYCLSFFLKIGRGMGLMNRKICDYITPDFLVVTFAFLVITKIFLVVTEIHLAFT